MMYARVNFERTKILEIGGRPDWFTDDGPVSDEILASGGLDGEPRDGWIPIIDASSDHDPETQDIHWKAEEDWIIQQNQIIRTNEITNKNLNDIKNNANTNVDMQAENVRSRFLTQGGPGQALEYDETRREVEAWSATADPDIDDFPMLRAEYRARQVAEPDITVEQVVSDTQAEIAIWKQVGSAIKEIRRTAKVALEVAETRERIRQVHDWAIMAFQSASLTGQFEPLSGN